MAPRTIPNSASVDTLWEEAVYTEARINSDPNASDLAASQAKAIKEIEDLYLSQRGAWRAELMAQAALDGLNDQLDELVVDFADTLFFVVRDRKSQRFTRYFAKSPYTIVRMALAAELEVVRGWPESLNREQEDALKAFAPKFAGLIEKAAVATAARTKAASARADHRTHVIGPLIATLNSERNTLHAELVKRGEAKKLGKYWADTFFRVPAARKDDAPAPQPTPPAT
jgi:hypothetical protein